MWRANACPLWSVAPRASPRWAGLGRRSPPGQPGFRALGLLPQLVPPGAPVGAAGPSPVGARAVGQCTWWAACLPACGGCRADASTWCSPRPRCLACGDCSSIPRAGVCLERGAPAGFDLPCLEEAGTVPRLPGDQAVAGPRPRPSARRVLGSSPGQLGLGLRGVGGMRGALGAEGGPRGGVRGAAPPRRAPGGKRTGSWSGRCTLTPWATLGQPSTPTLAPASAPGRSGGPRTLPWSRALCAVYSCGSWRGRGGKAAPPLRAPPHRRPRPAALPRGQQQP